METAGQSDSSNVGQTIFSPADGSNRGVPAMQRNSDTALSGSVQTVVGNIIGLTTGPTLPPSFGPAPQQLVGIRSKWIINRETKGKLPFLHASEVVHIPVEGFLDDLYTVFERLLDGVGTTGLTFPEGDFDADGPIGSIKSVDHTFQYAVASQVFQDMTISSAARICCRRMSNEIDTMSEPELKLRFVDLAFSDRLVRAFLPWANGGGLPSLSVLATCPLKNIEAAGPSSNPPVVLTSDDEPAMRILIKLKELYPEQLNEDIVEWCLDILLGMPIQFLNRYIDSHSHLFATAVPKIWVRHPLIIRGQATFSALYMLNGNVLQNIRPLWQCLGPSSVNDFLGKVIDLFSQFSLRVTSIALGAKMQVAGPFAALSWTIQGRALTFIGSVAKTTRQVLSSSFLRKNVGLDQYLRSLVHDNDSMVSDIQCARVGLDNETIDQKTIMSFQEHVLGPGHEDHTSSDDINMSSDDAAESSDYFQSTEHFHGLAPSGVRETDDEQDETSFLPATIAPQVVDGDSSENDYFTDRSNDNHTFDVWPRGSSRHHSNLVDGYAGSDDSDESMAGASDHDSPSRVSAVSSPRGSDLHLEGDEARFQIQCPAPSIPPPSLLPEIQCPTPSILSPSIQTPKGRTEALSRPGARQQDHHGTLIFRVPPQPHATRDTDGAHAQPQSTLRGYIPAPGKQHIGRPPSEPELPSVNEGTTEDDQEPRHVTRSFSTGKQKKLKGRG